MNHAKTILSATELKSLEQRLRLKSRACRFVEAAQLGDPKENAKINQEMITDAKELQTNLWMCRREFVVPSDPAALTLLAECFEVTAIAVHLLTDIKFAAETNGLHLSNVIELLADAQSHLRIVARSMSSCQDADQIRIFFLLKSLADGLKLFMPSLALGIALPTPEILAALKTRIERAQEQLAIGRCLDVRLFKLQQMVSAKPETEAQWQLVAKTVCELVASGMKASSIAIRKILLPVYEQIPPSEEYGPHFDLVMREIDQYLASRPTDDETLDNEEPTTEVLKVRTMLEGKRLVLIGGQTRKAAQRKLKDAFGLEELIWISTKRHESVSRFESSIHASGVDAVLLAIRFSSHGFGDVKSFCEKAGVPLVRLPAGYGRNQVAHQILEQCGNRLNQKQCSA